MTDEALRRQIASILMLHYGAVIPCALEDLAALFREAGERACPTCGLTVRPLIQIAGIRIL